MLGEKEAMRITKWSPTIYFGGYWGAVDEAALQERGVTAVCNLTGQEWWFARDAADEDGYRERGMAYLRLGQDDGDEVPRETIERFLAWMRERDRAGDVVYLHCQMGISRTPSFLICWLLDVVGADSTKDVKGLWSRFEDKIGRLRRIISPHAALKRSIIAHFEGKAA
jgi:hypothetical protein